MDAETLKQMYGDEYPAAIMWNGIRMPLCEETRFMRFFQIANEDSFKSISRFLDGSAHLSFEDLKRELPNWSLEERSDFHLGTMDVSFYEQADGPDMLRYIVANGIQYDWVMVAHQLVIQLSQNEAFELLAACLKKRGEMSAENLMEAIVRTKHPEAEKTLRAWFKENWENPKLWDEDLSLNMVAFDTLGCIRHLISMGVSPKEFEEQVRALAKHPGKKSREYWREFFRLYFPWFEPVYGNEFGEIIENSGE
jgi:hypothetical protein